ncbi:hypothetical protein BDF20DRAFT_989197 [Mycotypha africana]|uniref:uncharacterized protein n=1 Tax=Mycotypha africana TaxID=64632 RepID=UPI0023002D43|nr:uncharacterized protein BDF20DRAFT_989197 [Mycotypha africana]KAI8973172.1 hypothetical protein BDF20DRAFT_989197 [Mycotypha africana]
MPELIKWYKVTHKSILASQKLLRAQEEKEFYEELFEIGAEEKREHNEESEEEEVGEEKSNFLTMKPESKWYLSTGKCVEDELFALGMQCQHDHPSHSSIIVARDNNYKTCKPHNSHDLDWVQFTIYALLRECESGSLEKDHSEACYIAHVWHFVDTVFNGEDKITILKCSKDSTKKERRWGERKFLIEDGFKTPKIQKNNARVVAKAENSAKMALFIKKSVPPPSSKKQKLAEITEKQTKGTNTTYYKNFISYIFVVP